MSEHRLGLEQATQKWLADIGFVHGDPFEENDAYFERIDLPSYFHATSAYDAIVGNPLKPETKLVFAARGSGKTAHWAMLLHESQPQKSSGRLGRVLAIPHIRFDQLWELYRSNNRITSMDHVRVLLKYGARTFLETLLHNAERARKFPAADLGRLRWFCDEFAPELLQVDSVKTCLELVLKKFPLTWNAFVQAVEKQALLRKLKPHTTSPTALFLAKLVDSPSRSLNPQLLTDELLAEFVKLVRHADLDAVYILIDQLDATTEAQQNPQLAVTLLEPLVADLHLMQGDGWAFKIFLPEETRPFLLKPNTRLGEWMQRHDLRIEWDKDALREMLHSRLKFFSNEKCASLDTLSGISNANSLASDDQVSTEKTNSHSARKPKTIEEAMLDEADRSPRRLFQFGKYLFDARVRRYLAETQTARAKSKEILTWADWFQAISRFAHDEQLGPMTLRLDPDSHRIFKGPYPIQLTPKEYDFLKCLDDNKGRCDRKILVTRVWGPDAQDDPQMVAQLVKRIRQKIENDWKKPTHLITEKGYGFKFNLQAE